MPVVVVAVLVARDWVSAAIVAFTLPLIPLFMALVGAGTRERMDAQVRSLQRLGGHFLDVVAGLPTLKVFGRAKAQAAAIETVSGRYREHALGTLRIAFLSSLVLELLATVSMALVAVADRPAADEREPRVRDRAARAGARARGVPAAAPAGRELPRGRRGRCGGRARSSTLLDAPLPARGTRVDVPDPAAHPIAVEGLRVVFPGRGHARSTGSR